MGKFIDLTGQKFGRWTVLERTKNKQEPNGKYITMWLCKCECGTVRSVSSKTLRSGESNSCGCYGREVRVINSTKHGDFRTRLYKAWLGIKQRTMNPNEPSYKNYGGRGVAVCEEWKNSYEAFRDWALKNGYNENAKKGECTIDRIDVNGNYEPSNCRWITNKEQQNNRTNNHMVTYQGRTQTLKQWCEELELSYFVILSRLLKYGWDAEKAFETPIKHKNKILYYRGEGKTLTEWCDILNLNYHTIHQRMFR